MRNPEPEENDLLLMANLSNDENIETIVDMVAYCKGRERKEGAGKETYTKMKKDLLKALRRILLRKNKRKNDATKSH